MGFGDFLLHFGQNIGTRRPAGWWGKASWDGFGRLEFFFGEFFPAVQAFRQSFGFGVQVIGAATLADEEEDFTNYGY